MVFVMNLFCGSFMCRSGVVDGIRGLSFCMDYGRIGGYFVEVGLVLLAMQLEWHRQSMSYLAAYCILLVTFHSGISDF